MIGTATELVPNNRHWLTAMVPWRMHIPQADFRFSNFERLPLRIHPVVLPDFHWIGQRNVGGLFYHECFISLEAL